MDGRGLERCVEPEGGWNTLGSDEVDGWRSGEIELDSKGPEEFEDRDGRGVWVGECVLAENTRLYWGDSARRGGFSGGGTGEPLNREETVSRFGDAEG